MKRQKKFQWIALKISLLILVIFILQVIFPQVTESFSLVSSEIASRPWLLLTSIFLHGSIVHLLYNMFALFLFGSLLEKHVGSARFIFIFLFTGIIASIAAAFFYPASLGASGAIYGIIGALVVLKPFMLVWAFGVPMPMIIAGILWGLIDFAGFSSYLSGLPSGIANAAHLAGIFSGVFLGLILRNYLRWQKLKRRGLARKYAYHEERMKRIERKVGI